MEVKDKGYVVINKVCRRCEILTVSPCQRYLNVGYWFGGHCREVRVEASSFSKNWHRAKEIQNAR
jgi:hypothetical protein